MQTLSTKLRSLIPINKTRYDDVHYYINIKRIHMAITHIVIMSYKLAQQNVK